MTQVSRKIKIFLFFDVSMQFLSISSFKHVRRRKYWLCFCFSRNRKKNKYSFERVLFSNLFRILTFSNQFMYNFERFQGSEGSKNSTTKKLRMQFIWFLVGAFLEKRVDYSHGFSSVFFFRYT